MPPAFNAADGRHDGPAAQLAAAHAELAADVCEVVFHRVDARASAPGDVRATQSVQHPVEDLPLCRREEVRVRRAATATSRGHSRSVLATWPNFPTRRFEPSAAGYASRLGPVAWPP